MQIFEEMVTLCCGLLTSGISGVCLADSIILLAIKICLPGMAFLALARTLGVRFLQNQPIEDFREAIALLDGIISHRPREGDGRSLDWLRAIRIAADPTILHSVLYQNSENLEDTISRVRASLTFYPLEMRSIGPS